MSYKNPIIPGYAPDPTCIYHAPHKLYYLLTSSFLSFPGLPIYTSPDLRTWTLAGNVVEREEQLPRLGQCGIRFPIGGGLWAPSLRERDGWFYLTVTLVFPQTEYGAKERWENLLFKTRDPLRWGNPVKFDFPGYDTSLAWDHDGTAYVQGAHYWRVRPEILQLPLDLETGAALGPPVKIWSGEGGKAPEAPHAYWKDGWWWLIIAEGGTEAGHMSTMARSRSLTAPAAEWESCPQNPVLTSHPSDTPSPDPSVFTTIGHADLFQSPAEGDEKEGRWWAVALATRDGRDGRAPMGRESVLVPVVWEEGEWPVFGKVEAEVAVELPVGAAPSPPAEGLPLLQEGETEDLLALCRTSQEAHQRWPLNLIFLRLPTFDDYALSSSSDLLLTPSVTTLADHPLAPFDPDPASPSHEGSATFIARRQTDLEGSMFAILAHPSPAGGKASQGVEAGIAVFLDETHHCLLGISAGGEGARGGKVFLRSTAEVEGGKPEATASLPSTLKAGDKLQLKVEWTMAHYVFSYRSAEVASAEWRSIGPKEGLDSKDVSGGFTGALVGVWAAQVGAKEVAGEGERGRVSVSEWVYESRRRH